MIASSRGRHSDPCPGDPFRFVFLFVSFFCSDPFRGHFPFLETLLEHKPPLANIPFVLSEYGGGVKNNDFSKQLCFFGIPPPGAGSGPKMCPRGPAFEPRSVAQIQPMAARLVAKLRFEKIAGADDFGSQLFNPEGTHDFLSSFGALLR